MLLFKNNLSELFTDWIGRGGSVGSGNGWNTHLTIPHEFP